MTRLVLELDTERVKRLQQAAARTKKSEAQVCKDALDSYLSAEIDADQPLDDSSYEPLMQMIGVATGGPQDGSVQHDYRPGDPM